MKKGEQWLDAQELSDTGRRELEDAIAQAWALRNPRAAADWLHQQSAAVEAGARLSDVIRLWADWEPVQCADWLNAQLSRGQNMDGAIDAFVRTIVRDEPSTALTWAAQMDDPGQRRKTAEWLGEALRRQSVTNPEEMIRNSRLSPSDQAAALHKIASN